jgi:hypothetical protein
MPTDIDTKSKFKKFVMKHTHSQLKIFLHLQLKISFKCYYQSYELITNISWVNKHTKCNKIHEMTDRSSHKDFNLMQKYLRVSVQITNLKGTILIFQIAIILILDTSFPRTNSFNCNKSKGLRLTKRCITKETLLIKFICILRFPFYF